MSLNFDELMALKHSNRDQLLIRLDETLEALYAQGPEVQQEWLERQKQALMPGIDKKRPERFRARIVDFLCRE